MTNNELIDVLKNKKDEEFIKIIRHFKNRIKQIEKKEKLDAIDKKFKEKGIQCPNCKSYWCVKNGFKNNKQKYLCKDCKSSFDALRNHFLHWSHLSHEQWDWVIWLSLLGQSAYTISQFAKISKTSAWFNRQKFMKSPQLAKTQKSFIKLKGRIEIDETFIKEIHKGNFKNPDDPRKKWIEENAKDLNCCIEMAIDENKNIYAQTTNTKRLTKKWVQENLTSKLIEEKSIIACDMQILYDTVAKQTNCNLQQFKTSTNKELNYKNLSNISKIQSSLKEFITHYHGIGFTNIQNYLLIFKKTLDITFNLKLKVIFLYQRWFFVTNNELIDVLKNKKDEEFIKIIRHFKNRIKQIEKKEKLDAIDKKFKEKGIQCPNCKSYWCVKNGFKNNKQKYLCKDCKSSFDALRNHFLHWSHLSHEQWDWVIWLSLLGQSAYTISQFAKISKTSAWFNRQKFMKSPQLAKTQKSFIKLKGRIEIDETFIKEIHKGNFKNPDDPRKKWIEENAKDLNCCIEMAIDENKNIYAQTTNTKRLTKKWVQENLTSKLIEEKSIIACDMQILYDTVAKQTNCNLQQFKTSTNKELNYKNLSNISKIQSSLKEFITHYHGIGFTNIQNYLNLWKFKYQHYKISPYAKSEALYFSL